ncbi:MAG: transposase [Candidatus Syntrophopropionicum ammoniitolerans]
MYWQHHNYRLAHKEETGKYPAAAEDKERYGCSFRNHVYRKMREMYPDMASSNTSQTNQFAMSRWQNDVREIMRLQKSIPSFRLGTPAQVANANYTLSVEEQDNGRSSFIATITLLSLAAGKQTRYSILLDGGDRSKKAIFRRIMEGEYKQGAMQITYNKRKKKWFCIVSFSFIPEKQNRELDPDRAMGLMFGTGNYTVFAAYSVGQKRYTLPAGEVIATEKKIHAIAERRKEIQRHAGYRGHGIKRKLQGTEVLAGQASAIRDTLNHKYSRRVVDVAMANRCGTIKILDKLVTPSASVSELVNYPWAGVVEKIKYKAEEKGIAVKVVSLDGTRCHKCDAEIEIDSDNESPLTCPSCGAKIDKDYNTAKRIAKS